MDYYYKNSLAAVLLHLVLIFCDGYAMDMPEMPKQGALVVKEDPGAVAINWANQYLAATTDLTKNKVVGLLSAYLDKLVTDDYDNEFLRTTIYDPTNNSGWIGVFQTWQLSKDDNGNKKIQEFKNNIYNSYYRTQDKDFMCRELQQAAKNLRGTESSHNLKIRKFYRQDLTNLLSLLSDKLPYRKNKIDVLIKDLKESRNYGQLLGQALKEICEKESIIECAQKIAQDSTLKLAEKRQGLENLQKNAQSNRPEQRLLLSLWEKDIEDLNAVINNLTSESIKDLLKTQQAMTLGDVVINIRDLKNTIYDVSQRDENIKILFKTQKALKSIDSNPEMERQPLVLGCRVKVEYMLDILKMWKAFDESSKEFNSSDFATTILSIRACVGISSPEIGSLNLQDIKKIDDLIKNPLFADFIERGFYELDLQCQQTILESCQKIRENKGLENFPLPGKQVQSPSQSPMGETYEQPVKSPTAETPNEKQQRIARNQRAIDQAMALQQQQEELLRRRREEGLGVFVPEELVQRTQQENNQPQGWFARASAVLSELVSKISAGFSWIWRMFFRG